MKIYEIIIFYMNDKKRTQNLVEEPGVHKNLQVIESCTTCLQKFLRPYTHNFIMFYKFISLEQNNHLNKMKEKKTKQELT